MRKINTAVATTRPGPIGPLAGDLSAPISVGFEIRRATIGLRANISVAASSRNGTARLNSAGGVLSSRTAPMAPPTRLEPAISDLNRALAASFRNANRLNMTPGQSATVFVALALIAG